MEDVKSPSHALLHSFCVRPHARFESQIEGETVLLVLRAHPITQLSWVLNGIFIAVLLVVVDVVGSGIFSPQQFVLFNMGVISFIFAYYWFNFLSYFFNVGIITNHRVLDVDINAVIYKEVTEAKIQKIEDITAKSAGYFGSLFNYGNVFVQTAGSELNIEFIHVPRPTEVVKIINSATL